ncbi:MAG: pitrilysin family protein [Dysgonomonas sp.]|nr:pitrilysin family protein [Dysgonomonas sp.]
MKKSIYILFTLLLSIPLSAQIDRSVQPKPGPAPTVNLGKPHSFELPNGLKVLVVENHKLPRVTFSLSLDNPPSLEGTLKGVDDLASSMLGNGTSSISKEKYNEELDFYGASVSFGVHSVKGNTLSKYFPQVLSLAAQGALNPLFVEDELESERAKLLDAIKANEKSAKAIASRVRRVLLYGKEHPKGEYLTEQTINKVSLQDIKAYYKNYFVPENAYLVVVGDVKLGEVKKLVTENFSSWQKASAPKSKYKEPTNLTRTEIAFVDVPNAVQSEISVSNVVGLKMTDPDYFAALLANYILGGGSDSYLFMNLREAHGWTYGSYSSISGSKYVSDFTATAAVRNAVTDSAVVEMMNEIKKIRTSLPTQGELDLAKAKYTGNFVMNAEKPQTIAGFALTERTQSLPSDFYENYIKNLNAVTLDEVRAAAKKYFSDDAARIVIAGKASDVLPNLEKLNIPIRYYDAYGNLAAKPEEKNVDTGISVNSILEKYLQAIGGKSVLEAVKTISYTAEADVQGQKLLLEKKATSDGKIYQTMTFNGMALLKTVFNGENGYIEVQGKRQEMKEDDIAELKKYNTIFPELLMLNSPTLKIGGAETINGIATYRLVDGDSSYYYGIDSGLKIANGVTKEISPGQVVDQMSVYEEYKDYSGIKYPNKFTNNIGMEIKLNIIDLQFNESIEDSQFQ